MSVSGQTRMLLALRQCAEAFQRRHQTTGTNSWDYEAMQECKAILKQEMGLVLDSDGKWQRIEHAVSRPNVRI